MIKSVVLLLLISCLNLWAGISVDLEPNRIEEGKEFSLSIVVPLRELPKSYEFPQVLWPEGFEVLDTSRTQDVHQEFFSGRYKVQKFNFKVKAGKSGRHQVGPLIWKVNGKNVTLGKVNVDIQRSYGSASMAVYPKVSKSEPWEGEQFSYHLTFYAYQNFKSGPGQLQSGFGKDFWGELDDEKFVWKQSKDPGYIGSAFLKGYLSPISSGELTIPKHAFKYAKKGEPKRVVKENKSGNFYSRSETIEQQTIEDTAYAAPVKLKVKPLPQLNRPDKFSGLVGKYKMKVDFDQHTLTVGSPLAISISISGDGRPGYIPNPEFPDMSDFRAVPPEMEIKTKLSRGKIITTKILKYFYYPRRQMDVELNNISLNYFDVKKTKYVTLSGKSHKLTVIKGDVDYVEPEVNEVKVDSETNSSKDLETKSILNKLSGLDNVWVKYDGMLYSKNGFWWALFLILFLIPLKFVVHNLVKLKEKNSPKVEKKKAISKALNLIQAQQNSNQKESVSKIQMILEDMFEKKYQILIKSLTFDDLKVQFLENKIDEELVERWINWFKSLDSYRYSGATEVEERLMVELISLVESLEGKK